MKEGNIIISNTTTRFGFWDRIKILLGSEVRIHTEIRTVEEEVTPIDTHVDIYVSVLFPKTIKGGYSEQPITDHYGSME